MASQIDDLLTTTTEKWANKELADNIFQTNPLFYKLREGAKACDGGTYIEEPVLYQKSVAVDSYTGYDPLNVSAQQGMARAEFNWVQYAASITIDGRTEMQNMGEAKIIDLLEQRANQAKKSLFDRFNTDLYDDGTGNGGKNIVGLKLAVDSTGTYGGFSRSTYTWWAANETAQGGALTIAGMRTLFNNCSSDGSNDESPDLLITTQSIHEAYEGLLQPDQRFTNSKLADGGFRNLEFRGVPITWDRACTAQTMFFLNTKYLAFRFHPQRNFKPRGFQTPANQDAKVNLILWMGALTGRNCRRQGKLTGITG